MTGAIVGRDRELAVLDRLLDLAAEGAHALLFEGEPGIGKTTLWEEAVRRSAARDIHVLSSRPGESDARLTFAGLADLLSAASAALEEIPGPQRRALDVALLRADAGASPPDQRHISVGLLSVLQILSASRPVVVAVDDLQWLDRPSFDVLLFALRRLSRGWVRLLAGVRVEEDAVSRDLADALGGRLERVPLGPLSVGAIHEILSTRLGHSFPRPVLVRIGQVSAGNPFYALELGRALLASPEPVSASGPLPVSGDVLGLMRRRIADLPAPTRRALLAAAALAHPTIEELGAEAIEPAEEAGLVHVQANGSVVFDHPLFASAVYGAAPASRRRATHREIAHQVADPEERARHLALATIGHDETIAAALDAVADAARARGSAGSAAELAELALRLTPPADHEAALRRTVTLAKHLFHAGGDTRARELLEAALADTPAGDMRSEALVALSEILWGDGDWERAVAVCEEALATTTEPSLRARAHAQLAAMGDVDVSKAAVHARAALDLLVEEAEPVRYAEAVLNTVMWEFYAGRAPLDLAAVDRAVALRESAGSWDISTVPAGLARNADDYETARARYEQYLRRAAEESDELRRAILLAHLSTLECSLGEVRHAEIHARESLEIVEHTGQLAFRCVALHAYATVDAHLGRLEEARSAGGEILETLADQPDPVLDVMVSAVLGFVALSDGDPEGAWARFVHAQTLLDSMGWREPAPFRFQADQIEAAVALGRLDEAGALLERFQERQRVFARPWIAVTSARCEALLLAAHGDLEPAESTLVTALAGHDELPLPIERGRTLLCLGQVQRRRRKLRAARERFAEAVEAFDGIGATVWADRARAELARTHVREAPLELTPTEQRVAELAAAGLTNRVIAERLFVSPKTVESNLSRVYRKLDIRTRAELGRVMAERERPAKT